MNAREFMATYKSGPASERITADAAGRTTQRSDCQTCGGVGSYEAADGGFLNCYCTEGGDTACSTPSSSGSDTSSSSVDDIVAGILECLGKADGLWLSRGEILILARTIKGGGL